MMKSNPRKGDLDKIQKLFPLQLLMQELLLNKRGHAYISDSHHPFYCPGTYGDCVAIVVNYLLSHQPGI